MDKYEYKVRSEEIKELIARKEYAQAAEIADTIDWRRVKSVMMLCTISDLYKINRRYEDSRDLLLLAYDRHPGGRTIVYALCELSIKMGNVTQAWEYYKEYLQIAPKDAGRYILQYKIYEAEEVNLEERIEVLEELKKRDYRDRWAYELAYLYHRIGLASKCVDECDEMIVWFGDGKYVIKAMELKMLHQPLTLQQQAQYDRRFEPEQEVEAVVEEAYEQVQQEPAPEATTTWSGQQVVTADGLTEVEFAATRRIPVEDIDIQVKTIDPGKCGTINLQAELAAGLKEILDNKSQDAEITRAIIAPMLETDDINRQAVEKALGAENVAVEPENAYEAAVEEPGNVYEAAVAEPGIMYEAVPTQAETAYEVAEDESAHEAVAVEAEAEPAHEGVAVEAELATETISTEAEAEFASEEAASEALNEELLTKDQQAQEALQEPGHVDDTAVTVMEQLRQERTAEPPKEMAQVLSMEADGQISFIMPEKEAIEKQITGQISIADVMAEWERKKKEIEEKNKEKIRQNVKRDTNRMFDDFEASMRDGLLEQLERGRDLESVIAEAEGRTIDEDGIPIPPSLVEEAEEEPAKEVTEEEGFVEDYEEISFEEARQAVEFVQEPEAEKPTEEEQSAFVAEAAVEEDVVESVEEELQTYEEQAPAEEELQAYEEQAPTEEELQAYEEQAPAEESREAEEVSEAAIDRMVEAVLSAEDEVEELIEIEDLTEEDEAAESVEGEGEAPDWTEKEAGSEFVQEEEAFEEPEQVFSEIDAAYEAALMGATEEADDGKGPGIDYETISMPIGEVETAIKQESVKQRNLTREERELFSPYIQGRSSKMQLVQTIDNISMAAYTGNVVITGAEGLDTLGLARDIIQNVQMTDSNFSGKIAKISGESLNKRDVTVVLEGLDNGALIVQRAAAMNAKTVESLHKALQQEHMGIVVILEGTKKAMNAFLEKNKKLSACFTGRIDMEALSDAALVAFGKKYAREKEYSIDEFGGLALSRRIAERQTSDHAVTILEVKEIVDAAIESANRKTLGHFFDVLMAKRYDDEDMIIIKEKDFR